MFTVDSLLLRCLLFHCIDCQGPLDKYIFRIYETKKDFSFESWVFIVVRLFIPFILGISILFGHPVKCKKRIADKLLNSLLLKLAQFLFTLFTKPYEWTKKICV